MKRAETIKVLTAILQKKEKEIQALEGSINALRIAIREVEIAEDVAVTTSQRGTFRQELTDAMYGILNEHGPLHRNVILEKLQELGIHIGGGINTVGSYLSVDNRFKSVGKGLWDNVTLHLEDNAPLQNDAHNHLIFSKMDGEPALSKTSAKSGFGMNEVNDLPL